MYLSEALCDKEKERITFLKSTWTLPRSRWEAGETSLLWERRQEWGVGLVKMLGWDVRAIQRSQPLSWLFCGHTQSWCCSLYSQARTAALELAVAGGHCSGRPPWSSVWRPGILAETGCVNKNHSSYSLSLCCVTGQIRNVFGLKFKLSTWSSMWKDEPASWERGLSFAWMQAGTWKAGQLSLGVKNRVKIFFLKKDISQGACSRRG